MKSGGDTSESVVGIDDDLSDCPEPPAKRRSLSPDEDDTGDTSSSLGWTRSGKICRSTSTARKAQDQNSRPPEIAEPLDPPKSAPGTEKKGVKSQSSVESPLRPPPDKKSTSRPHMSSPDPPHSLSSDPSEAIWSSNQPIHIESVIDTIETSGHKTRRKHPDATLPSPEDSISRSRATRSPSSVLSWWRFELCSPPRTPTRSSETPEVSHSRPRKHSHRKRSSKGEAQLQVRVPALFKPSSLLNVGVGPFSMTIIAQN